MGNASIRSLTKGIAENRQKGGYETGKIVRIYGKGRSIIIPFHLRLMLHHKCSRLIDIRRGILST
jgi:hypothetical protein